MRWSDRWVTEGDGSGRRPPRRREGAGPALMGRLPELGLLQVSQPLAHDSCPPLLFYSTRGAPTVCHALCETLVP